MPKKIKMKRKSLRKGSRSGLLEVRTGLMRVRWKRQRKMNRKDGLEVGILGGLEDQFEG